MVDHVFFLIQPKTIISSPRPVRKLELKNVWSVVFKVLFESSFFDSFWGGTKRSLSKREKCFKLQPHENFKFCIPKIRIKISTMLSRISVTVGDQHLIISGFHAVKGSIKRLSSWVQPAVINVAAPKCVELYRAWESLISQNYY